MSASVRPPARTALLGEWLYRAGAKLAQRTAREPLRLPGAAVVSVGNLEVGGGGKTPCVLWWAQALAARGTTAAVVARPWGAKTPSGMTDEIALLADRLPTGVRLIAGPDKTRSAARAHDEGARVIVVDDGFSHRSLARELDVLLLDARRPFGNGHCLPAGTLREPPESCARADVIVLTRADRADAGERHRSRERVLAAGYEGPVLQARHRVVGVREGERWLEPAGLAVFCASGIGRPGELAEAATAAGLCVRGAREFADHHAFGAGEWQEVITRAQSVKARVLVTAKDAVRLAPEARAQVLVLEIAWDWMEGDLSPDKLVDQALAAVEVA